MYSHTVDVAVIVSEMLAYTCTLYSTDRWIRITLGTDRLLINSPSFASINSKSLLCYEYQHVVNGMVSMHVCAS